MFLLHLKFINKCGIRRHVNLYRVFLESAGYLVCHYFFGCLVSPSGILLFIRIENELVFLVFRHRNNIIIPSDLTLYNNLHVICHVGNGNIADNIQSLANIYKNYYKCIEYLNINDKKKFGISFNKESFNDLYTIYIFDDTIINYNNLHNSISEFDPLIINKIHASFTKINQNGTDENIMLNKLYVQQPKFFSKKKSISTANNWEFINLYNCF